MSQQFGMEPSHSPPWGPMLVSQYKLLHISLAESQCSSCRILIETESQCASCSILIETRTRMLRNPPSLQWA